MRHWRVRDIFGDNMAWVESPSMTQDPDGTKIFTDFSTKRQLYTQFKRLEVMIRKDNMKGWVVNTEMTRPNVMTLIVKCGGQPFHIDLKTKSIWFQKVFR
jgi:SH3-like domain-containing protein